jgi:hypothetical protein
LVYLEGDPLTAAVKIPPKLKHFIWAVTVCIWIAEAVAATGRLNADAVSYLNKLVRIWAVRGTR